MILVTKTSDQSRVCVFIKLHITAQSDPCARESDCAVRRELCFGKKTLKEPIIQTHNFEF